MSLKFFYTDYCEDKEISSEDAWSRTKEEILHSMDCVLHMPRNFLGIIDADELTLQFLVNDDKSITIDIPQVERQGSLTKKANLEECLAIVSLIDGGINIESIDGLEFVRW